MAKEIWDALDIEYRMDNDGLDWFTMSKFIKNYMMESRISNFFRKAMLIGCKFSKSYKLLVLTNSLLPS